MYSNQIDGYADHISAAASSQQQYTSSGQVNADLARGAQDNSAQPGGERNGIHTLLQNDQTISFKRGSFVENSASGSHGVPPTSQKKIESDVVMQDQLGVATSLRPFQQTQQWSDTPHISTNGAEDCQQLQLESQAATQPTNFTLPAGHAALAAGRNDTAAILGGLDTFNQRSQSLRQRMQKFNDRLFETDKILMLHQGLTATRSKGTGPIQQPGQDNDLAYGQTEQHLFGNQAQAAVEHMQNQGQESLALRRAGQEATVSRRYHTDYSSQVMRNRKVTGKKSQESSSPVRGAGMMPKLNTEKADKVSDDVSSSEADLDDPGRSGGTLGLPKEVLEQLHNQQQMAQQAGINEAIGSYRQLRIYTSESVDDDDEWPEDGAQRPGILLQHPTQNAGYMVRQQNYHATQPHGSMFVVGRTMPEVIQENSLEVSAMSNSKNNSGALLNGRGGPRAPSGGIAGIMSSQARSHNSNTDGMLTVGNNTNDYRSGTAYGNGPDRLGYSTSIQNGRLISTNNLNEEDEEEMDSQQSMRPIEEQLVLSDCSKQVGTREASQALARLNCNSNTGSDAGLPTALPLSRDLAARARDYQEMQKDCAVPSSLLTTNNNSRKSVLLDHKRMDASSGDQSGVSHDPAGRRAPGTRPQSESVATPVEHPSSYRPGSHAGAAESTHEASVSQSRKFASCKPATVFSSRAVLVTRNQTLLASRQEHGNGKVNGARERSTVSNGTNDLTNNGKSEPICSDIETQRITENQLCYDRDAEREAPEHQRQQTSCFPPPSKSAFENTKSHDAIYQTSQQAEHGNLVEGRGSFSCNPDGTRSAMHIQQMKGASQARLEVNRSSALQYQKRTQLIGVPLDDSRQAHSSDAQKRSRESVARSHANLFRAQMSTSFSNLPYRFDATVGSSKKNSMSQHRGNGGTKATIATEKNSDAIMNQIKIQNERARSSEPGNLSSHGLPSPQGRPRQNMRLFQNMASVQNIHQVKPQNEHNNSTQTWSLLPAGQGLPDQIHDEQLIEDKQRMSKDLRPVEVTAEAAEGAISDSQKTFNLQRLLAKNESEGVNTGELPAEWLQALSQQPLSSGTQEQILRSLHKFKNARGVSNLTGDATGNNSRPRLERDHFDPWADSVDAKGSRQNDMRAGLRNYFIQSSLTFNGGDGAGSSMGGKKPLSKNVNQDTANEIEIWDGAQQTDVRRVSVAPLQESMIMKDDEDGDSYLELQRQSMQTDLQNPVIMVERQMMDSFTEIPEDTKRSKQQYIVSSNGRYKHNINNGQAPQPVKYHTRTNSYSQKMSQLIQSSSTHPLKQQVASSNSKAHDNSQSQLTQSQSQSNQALQAAALTSSQQVSTVDGRAPALHQVPQQQTMLVVHRGTELNESSILPTQLLGSTQDGPSYGPQGPLHLGQDQFATGDQTLAEALNAGGVRMSYQQTFDQSEIVADDHRDMSGMQQLATAFESHADCQQANKMDPTMLFEAQRDSLGRSTAAVGTYSNSQSRYAFGPQADASSIMPMRESVDSILLPTTANARKSQLSGNGYDNNTSQQDLMNSALEPQTIFDLPDALLRVQTLTQQINELQQNLADAHHSHDLTHSKLLVVLQSKQKADDHNVQLQEKMLRLETQILDLIEEKRQLRSQLDQLKLSMIDVGSAPAAASITIEEKENQNEANLPPPEWQEQEEDDQHYMTHDSRELMTHLQKLEAENRAFSENQHALEQQLLIMQEMMKERNAQVEKLSAEAQANGHLNETHAIEELRHRLELKERELSAVAAEKAERDKWLAAQYQHIGILTQQVERAWSMIAGTTPIQASSQQNAAASSMMSSQAECNAIGESCLQAMNDGESSRQQESIPEQNHFMDFNEHNGSFGGAPRQQQQQHMNEQDADSSADTSSPEPNVSNADRLQMELKNALLVDHNSRQQTKQYVQPKHSASTDPHTAQHVPLQKINQEDSSRHAMTQMKNSHSPVQLQYEPPIIQNVSMSPVTKEVAKLRQLFTNLTEHMAELVSQRQATNSAQDMRAQQQTTTSQLSNDLQDLTKQLKTVFAAPPVKEQHHHYSRSSLSNQDSVIQQERLLAQERVNSELRSENSKLQSKLGQVREQLAGVEVRLAFLQEQSRVEATASKQTDLQRSDTSMTKLHEEEVSKLRDQVLQARIDQQRALLQAKQVKLELSDQYQGQLKTLRGCLGFVLGRAGLKQHHVPRFLQEKLEISLSDLDLSQDLHTALGRYQRKIKSLRDQHVNGEVKLHEARRDLIELTHVLDVERKLKRNLLNQMQDLKGSVRVFCRIRPQLRHEQQRGFRHMNMQIINHNKLVVQGAAKKSYQFDRIFDAASTQGQVFDELQCLVQSALNGSNVCIMSYGQTGSGKTYTMVGDDRNPGLYFNTVDEIYRLLKHEQARNDLNEALASPRFELSCSIVEIYNEQIRDLLQKDQKNNEVRLLEENGRVHAMQTRRTISSKNHLLKALRDAFYNRTVGVTQFNEYSSRSHFVVNVYVRHWTPTGQCRNGQLTLVDLAGSERILQTEASGIRVKEAQNINRSLTTLTKVFLHLKKRSTHVPYRDSKLTHYLKDAIGGEKSKTVVIVQMSPLEKDRGESLGTLTFGARAQQIEKRANSVPATARGPVVECSDSVRPAVRRGRITQDKSKKRLQSSRSRLSQGSVSVKKSTCSRRGSNNVKPLLARSSEFLVTHRQAKVSQRHKRVASVRTHRAPVRSQSGTGKIKRRLRSYSETLLDTSQTARKPRLATGTSFKRSKDQKSRKRQTTEIQGTFRGSAVHDESQVMNSSSTRKRQTSAKKMNGVAGKSNKAARPAHRNEMKVLRLTPSAQRQKTGPLISQQISSRPLRLQDLSGSGADQHLAKQKNDSVKRPAKVKQDAHEVLLGHSTKHKQPTQIRDQVTAPEPMASTYAYYGGYTDQLQAPLVASTSVLSKSTAYDCKYYQFNNSGSVSPSVLASPLSRSNLMPAPIQAERVEVKPEAAADKRRIVKLEMNNKIFEVPQESEEESNTHAKPLLGKTHRTAPPHSGMLEVDAKQSKTKPTTARYNFEKVIVDGGHSDTSTRSGHNKTEHPWRTQVNSDCGAMPADNIATRMQVKRQSQISVNPSVNVLESRGMGRGQDLAVVDSNIIFSSHEGPTLPGQPSKGMDHLHNASMATSSQGLSSFYRGHRDGYQQLYETEAALPQQRSKEVYDQLSFDRPRGKEEPFKQDLLQNSRKSLTRRVSPHHLERARLGAVGFASSSEHHSTKGRLTASNCASELLPQYTTTDGGHEANSVSRRATTPLGEGIADSQAKMASQYLKPQVATNSSFRSGKFSVQQAPLAGLTASQARDADVNQYRNLRNELSHRDEQPPSRAEILVVEDGKRATSGGKQMFIGSGFKSNYAASYHANGGPPSSSHAHDETMAAEERRQRQCRLLDELQEVNKKLQDLDQKLIMQGRRVEERQINK